jgi:DNA adenine methylase
MTQNLFKLTSLDQPVRPPLGYPGGKNRLAPKILEHAPKHTTYVEPFMGSAAVFFAKPPAKRNVLNDIDPQLVRFFRNFSCPKLSSCVVNNIPTIANRRKFTQRFRNGSSDTCDYFMARRLSFNSNGKDVNIWEPVRKNVGKSTVKNCAVIKGKLNLAKITNEDFRKVVKQNDKPGTFQFWDPPYEGRAKGLYKFEENTSPEQVCGAARQLKHAKVLITHYNTPEVRQACRGLRMKTIAHQYVSRNRNHGEVHQVKELLISNYPI